MRRSRVRGEVAGYAAADQEQTCGGTTHDLYGICTAVQAIGKVCVLLGTGLVAVGLVLWLFGAKLGWLGRLPGDIRIGESVFIPITSCILVSVLLTLLLNVVARIFWR